MEQNRRSIRLPQYDYSQPGMYFITVLTHAREKTLCTKLFPSQELSSWGKIVDSEWKRLSNRFINIEMDDFIIMPDHLHGLILVKDMGTAATQTITVNDMDRRALTRTEGYGQPIRGSIPTIIRSFKAAVTNKIRRIEQNTVQVWHTNYYEHIVRNDEDLYRIRKYIVENPETLQYELVDCF